MASRRSMERGHTGCERAKPATANQCRRQYRFRFRQAMTAFGNVV
ncbi:MAG TPA: hypothetical protein VGL08_17460 [Paraburkholderia sp.]